MSQHNFTTIEGRRVLYGLDKPTGGYFFTEFWKDEEIVDDEVKNSKDALTLTELNTVLNQEYRFAVDLEAMVFDWDIDQHPSSMQYQVNSLFGKDLVVMLERVATDLWNNYA